MSMTYHNLAQGSDDWLALRANYFTASEAAAAMGKSKYQSRTDLLNQKKTGIAPEVGSATQALFYRGHAAEDTARAIAEKIVCDDLSPTTGTRDVCGLPLLASFDGITLDGMIVWEHKLINGKLAQSVREGNLEEHYKIQLDQQLLVSGAKKALFMVSDGTENNMEYCWYTTTSERVQSLIEGWKMFKADMELFEPSAEIAKPKAEAIAALPSIFVQASGAVTASNLDEFKDRATSFIAAIKTDLVTDQDFADADETVKFCKEAESNIEQVKKNITAQMISVDEVMRTLDHIGAQLREKRLLLDKLVKSEKEARKLSIVSKAVNDFTAYIESLESKTRPIKIDAKRPDFGAAIKGMKKLSSMQEAVDTALRDGKIAADALSRDMLSKLEWYKETSNGFCFLFADLDHIIRKPMDDFQMTVTMRINQHKIDKAAEEDAARKCIEAEVKEKAERKAAEKLEQGEARIREEERTKAEAYAAEELERVAAEAKKTHDAELASAIEKGTTAWDGVPIATKFVEELRGNTISRPTRKEIIETIAIKFNSSTITAEEWLTSEFKLNKNGEKK